MIFKEERVEESKLEVSSSCVGKNLPVVPICLKNLEGVLFHLGCFMHVLLHTGSKS